MAPGVTRTIVALVFILTVPAVPGVKIEGSAAKSSEAFWPRRDRGSEALHVDYSSTALTPTPAPPGEGATSEHTRQKVFDGVAPYAAVGWGAAGLDPDRLWAGGYGQHDDRDVDDAKGMLQKNQTPPSPAPSPPIIPPIPAQKCVKMAHFGCVVPKTVSVLAWPLVFFNLCVLRRDGVSAGCWTIVSAWNSSRQQTQLDLPMSWRWLPGAVLSIMLRLFLGATTNTRVLRCVCGNDCSVRCSQLYATFLSAFAGAQDYHGCDGWGLWQHYYSHGLRKSSADAYANLRLPFRKSFVGSRELQKLRARFSAYRWISCGH
jgi:hypothetical protein